MVVQDVSSKFRNLDRICKQIKRVENKTHCTGI